MIPMDVNLTGDNAWPELRDHPKVVHLGNGSPPIRVAVLDHGMSSGKPSVALRIDLPDGTVVIAETSARLFCTAGRMITAKHPDLFQD